MVYHIKNKGLMFNRQGYRAVFQSKPFGKVANPPYDRVVAVRNCWCKIPQIRNLHSYRVILRALKQFTYGNKRYDEMISTAVRAHFYAPLHHPLPIYEFNWMDKTLNDRLDRHYELMSYNCHPMQLFLYEEMNKELEENKEEQDVRASGEKTRWDYMEEQFAEEVQSLTEKFGVDMRPEQVIDILNKLQSRDRNYDKYHSKDERGPDRDVTDYLEVRRPLLEN